MIAVDSSSWIAYLAGDRGTDTDAVESALSESQVCLPPVVLTEIFSVAQLPDNVRALFQQIPLLAVSEGFWERTGDLRAKVLSKGRKAPLADALIAQSCLDHDTPLITRDTDFRSFAQVSGLKLL